MSVNNTNPNQSVNQAGQAGGKPMSKRPRKLSDYGQQLQEKQKTKRDYGLREKQFRRYFTEAAKNRAQTGQALLTLLEQRLDNVIFRAGLALSRPHARQMVSHRQWVINDHRVSVPSTQVKVGDKIVPAKGVNVEYRKDVNRPEWLTVSEKTKEIKVKRAPTNQELPIEYDSQKIIEFYSK